MIDPKTASFVDTCAKAKNTLSVNVNVTYGRKSLCRFETTKIKTAIWVFMLKVNTRSSEIKGATHRPFTWSACNFYEPETNMLQKAKVYSQQSISNRHVLFSHITMSNTIWGQTTVDLRFWSSQALGHLLFTQALHWENLPSTFKRIKHWSIMNIERLDFEFKVWLLNFLPELIY